MIASRLLLLVCVLCGGARELHAAGNCELLVEANDLMQYQQKSLQVDAGCARVKLTLKNVGKLPVATMGHDWVLARTADVNALANAGAAAGPHNNYLPPGDPRVIAATPLIGGGESVGIEFAGSLLQKGGDYTFFCSFPGHVLLMRGKLVVT